MNLLICCTCFWKTDFPFLCWGLVVAIVILWSLYIVRPLIKAYFESKISILKEQHSHEKEMKEKAFEREKEWNKLINIKASTDEALNDKIKNLTTSIEKLKKELESEKNNKDLLEKQLKLYSDIFKKLNVEIKPKEK